MASSSSSSSTTRCWKYDVFPSFSGEDVRQSFLSHLLKELHRIPVTTFLDQKIERSRLIASELLLAIQESRISIVVFSKKYASSTWCLNELLEIHRCCKELGQMVFPIFYKVDPSHVRKQTGEFGLAFENTCKDKTEDDKQRWSKVLAEVASIAGEHSQNWSDEAAMIEQISKDVLNKLFTPSDDFANYVGIEAHIKAIMDSKLCLKSKEARMVGIVGTSGIGKTTIARALYNRLSSQFPHHVFGHDYKRPIQDRKTADYSVKLSWANKFLSDILCHKDMKIDSLDDVKKRLEHRKVLIVLDDVDELELLQTLVGQTEWFGSGSRIVVVTQDRAILKSHNIDVIYEVELPSEDLALEMFCRSAFRRDSPPDGFRDLAVEVTKLAGYLPLGVTVLGSSFLGERKKEEWIKMMPRLRDGLDGKIEKTLKVSYDGLDPRDQDIFLHIACLFNGEQVNHIKNMLGNDDALRILAERSLIRIIRPSYDRAGVSEVVEMHGLLEKFGREIVRAMSIDNPQKRRFLMDAKDICDVFTDHDTGKENVVGIHFNPSGIIKTIDETAFVGMRNLRFLKVCNKVYYEGILFPQGVIYLPPKLRLLHWNHYPEESLPCSFNGEYLVELIMENSWVEKLWEGTKPLQNLKKMVLLGCWILKEIPDLSNATSLEILNLYYCKHLVELPSSIRNLIKLKELRILHCSNLKVLPTDVNLESLDFLDLTCCGSLESFPQISRNIARLYLSDTAIKDCLWLENLSGLAELVWDGCLLRCMPSKFHTEHLVILKMRYSKLKKLWDRVQPLQNLKKMKLNWSKRLKEIPDLSNATNLEILDLSGCRSLVALTSSIQNLKKLIALRMDKCLNIKFLPVDVNLESLNSLRLKKCSRLQTFPRISRNISRLYLDGTAMTKEDCLWFKNFSRLTKLEWKYCPLRYVPSGFLPGYLVKIEMRDSKLEKLWEGDQPLENLKYMDLSRSKSLKEIPNLSKATNLRKLCLSYCRGLVALPPSIQYLDKLEVLEMAGCTSLEVLPTNMINLVSLNWLNLYGCSRLISIPKISTSIEYLWLDYTAIEEVPWIENIAGLTQMSMSGCNKLRKIPATFRNVAGFWSFRDCLRKVKVSNASLVKTLVELHPARIEYYTETLTGVSCSTTEFLLARDAQEYIRKLDFIYGVIPGDQVPTYFTHRDRGASLSVPLPETESSLSTKKLAFAACINLDLPIRHYYITIFVRWKLGGVKGICRIIRGTNYHKLDHQLVFHFDFENGEEFDDPPSQLEFEFEAHRRTHPPPQLEFDFEAHKRRHYDFCGCYTFEGTGNEETCTIPPCNIEECGIRVLSVSPSLYEGNQQDGESDSERESFETEYADEESYTGSTSERSSFEPDYREQDGESDTESERSNEIEDSQKSREEIDAESGGSKPQLQMAVITSQEPSNLPSGQFPVAVPAPNLMLSLGLSRVSSHFHGDGTALNHSLPPYPFLEAESLYFDPMIAEHDDTKTISPQLINFFREEADAECGGSKQQLQTTVVTPNLEFSLRLCGASESSDHVSFRGKASSPSISMDANEIENNQPNGESDAASERSKKRKKMTVISFQEPSSPPCGQTVETGIQYSSKFPSLDANDKSSETEGGRSKKRMQMTVVTSQEPSNQEPSNQPGSQSLAPKLDLSSGLCGASSSLPGDRTSLDPCLEKEAFDDDLMIKEQEDTEEEPSVKPSFTSWFPNIFRFWK